MAGQVSKANARQGKHREGRYAAYKSSSRREKNKMRKMLKALAPNQSILIGVNHSIITVRKHDGASPAQACRSDISKAWARCADRTGVNEARLILNTYLKQEA